MKHLIVLYCVLNMALAVREKQIQLDDIEKDNLASERRSQQVPGPSKQQAQVPQHYQSHQQPATPPKLEYGFKPMKTQSYVQQIQYAPPQHHFNIAPQQFNLPQYFNYQAAHPQRQQQQYIAPPTTQQYIQPNLQYQHLDLPYITDNQLAQGTNAFQQYYNSQLVYLQQYPAASTSVQTVVDPKGAIQYLMYLQPQYVPGGKGEQTQNIQNAIPQEQLYTTQDITLDQPRPEQQYQFIEIPQQAQPQIQQQQQPGIEYVQQQHQPQPQPQPQKLAQYNFPQSKYEAKSLLDSYVPSYLQIQYIKEQQAHANAIRQPPKRSQPHSILGKSNFSKNYVPQLTAATSNYNFQFRSQPLKH